jgi:hypothetical protein
VSKTHTRDAPSRDHVWGRWRNTCTLCKGFGMVARREQCGRCGGSGFKEGDGSMETISQAEWEERASWATHCRHVVETSMLQGRVRQREFCARHNATWPCPYGIFNGVGRDDIHSPRFENYLYMRLSAGPPPSAAPPQPSSSPAPSPDEGPASQISSDTPPQPEPGPSHEPFSLWRRRKSRGLPR